MQNKKYLSMLGLARRAGRLSMGHDAALEAIRKEKTRLVIFSSDISERLVDEFERASKRVPCIRLEENMSDIHAALGYRAGVISVNDDNFAKRVIELINQEENVYGDKN